MFALLRIIMSSFGSVSLSGQQGVDALPTRDTEYMMPQILFLRIKKVERWRNPSLHFFFRDIDFGYLSGLG